MTTKTAPAAPGLRPLVRPMRPDFSSGPCAKPPGWSLDLLKGAVVGRSHRSKLGKSRLEEAIVRTRSVLEVPDDHLIGITPASDTGAMEMAMWSLLGPRRVQVLAFESFSKDWAGDVVKELRLTDCAVLSAPYGRLPDLTKVDPKADLVFAWNGTTSGVRVPDADFIAADREGLTICDATSACFAQALDFAKLDVVTFSWQKALGGEAAHGVLILSPRAVERLESYVPPWPMPKIFRLTKGGKLNREIFEGATINTPSMLCVEDYIAALKWAEAEGGLPALIARSDANLSVVEHWAAGSDWADFLAEDPRTRSNTSVCLKIIDPHVVALPPEAQAAFAKSLAARLEKEGAAFDVGAYRDAPPGLRIWCGATVQTADLLALLPWLDFAFAETKAALG
jgi:phosphoserine aminotransferase